MDPIDVKSMTADPAHFDPTSDMGREYARYSKVLVLLAAAKEEASAATTACLQLQAWVDAASLQTTTPEEFAVKQAELVLRRRALAPLEARLRAAQATHRDAKEHWGQVFRSYRNAVEAMAAAQKSGNTKALADNMALVIARTRSQPAG
jgi:hypothetical protein